VRNWKKTRSTHRDNSSLSKTGRSAGDVPRGRENEKDCRSMNAFSGKVRSGMSSEVGAMLAFGRARGVADVLI
jgi:hypothetical protein